MKKHLFQRLTKTLLFSSLAALFVVGGISAFSSNNDIKEAKAGSDYSGIPKNWDRGNGQLFDIYEAENHCSGDHKGERTGNNWSGNLALSIKYDDNYLYNSISRSCAGIYYFVLGLNHGEDTDAVVKTTANENTSDENFYTLNFSKGSWDHNAGPKTDHGFIYLKKGVNDIKITFTGSNGYVHFDYFAISQLPTQFEAEWAYVEGQGTLYTRETTPHTSSNTSYGKAVRTTKNQYIQSQVYAPQEISGGDYALSVAYYSNTINPLVSLYIDDVLVKSNINLRYINGLSTFIIGSDENSSSRLALAYRITNISIQPGRHLFKLVNSGSASGGDATIDFDYFELVKSSLDESPALPNELALIHDMNGKTSLSIESEYAAAYPGNDDFANPSTDPYFHIVSDYRSSNGFRTEFAHATKSFPAFEVLNATEGWYTLSFDGVPWFSNAEDTVTFRFSSHQDSEQITETYAQFVMSGKTEGEYYTNMTTGDQCNIYLKDGSNVIMYNYVEGAAYFDVDKFTLTPFKFGSSDGHFIIKLNDAWKADGAKTAVHLWGASGDYYSEILDSGNYLSVDDSYLVPIPDGAWSHAQTLRINPNCGIDEEGYNFNPYEGNIWSYSSNIDFNNNYNWYEMDAWGQYGEDKGKMTWKNQSNKTCVVGGESVYLDLNGYDWTANNAVIGAMLENGMGSSVSLKLEMKKVEGFDIGGSGEGHLYEVKVPSNEAFRSFKFFRAQTLDGEWWNSTGSETQYYVPCYTNVFKLLAYENSGTFDWNMTDAQRADCFGTYFLSQTGTQCLSYDTNTAASFSGIWTNVSAQYTNMSNGAETIFTNCNTIDPNVDTKYKDAAQRYDYILGKYGTDILSDFASRDGINISYSASARNPFGHLLINGELDYSVITIIIASSVALLSITALSILLVKKRKRKPID